MSTPKERMIVRMREQHEQIHGSSPSGKAAREIEKKATETAQRNDRSNKIFWGR